jgi:hypothetical protein
MTGGQYIAYLVQVSLLFFVTGFSIGAVYRLVKRL